MRRIRRPLRLLPAAMLAAAIAVAVLTGAANGGETTAPPAETVPPVSTTISVADEPSPDPAPDPCVERTAGKRTFGCGLVRWDGHGAEWWAREARQLERKLRAEWRPTVDYALRLAAAAFGDPRAVDRAVTLGELRAVARCESTFDPFNVNASSGASGLFQFLRSTWTGAWGAQRFHALGFSVLDPVANALAAAQTVARDGDWGQWVCKP